jgi:di/tricarboxylate transporter
MNVALISLCALGIAVLVSSTTPINVGILAIVLAWVVGIDFAGLQFSDILSGFPTQLFLTLTGVTLLFTQAHLNGTLDRVAHHAVRGCRGNTGLIPMMFFFLASFLASIGPGSTAMAGSVAISLGAV